MEFLRKNEKKEVWQVEKKGEVVYLSIPAFNKTGVVKNVFSTRMGGVSEGIYSSMNLSCSGKLQTDCSGVRLQCGRYRLFRPDAYDQY